MQVSSKSHNRTSIGNKIPRDNADKQWQNGKRNKKPGNKSR